MISSHSKSRAIAWAVWIIASVFYAYQYILRVMPSVMLDEIMGQFQIGAGAFGQFSGIYYIGYALMHLPLGIMLDRYGPRKVMTFCILLSVAGLLPLLFATHWIYPIAGRLLLGLGSSAAILGIFKIVRITFSKERFPRMLSLSVTIGLIGAIYGGGPLSYMKEVFGYQAVIQIFAGVGILLALATYLIVPKETAAPQASVLSDMKEVLSNKKVIFSCIFAGFMVGPLEGFADVWGTAFLKGAYGFDPALAASLPSIVFVGMCFGAPVLSLFAEKINNYLVTIIGAGALMALAFFFLLGYQLPPIAITVSFALIGMCSAYQILAIYKASTYARESVAGLTTAVANMIIMVFGYGFHSIMGSVINAMGGPSSAKALIYGVSVIPIGLAIGTVGFILLFAQERKQKAISAS